jgi:hypothetical protein
MFSDILDAYYFLGWWGAICNHIEHYSMVQTIGKCEKIFDFVFEFLTFIDVSLFPLNVVLQNKVLISILFLSE